jgi:hypothetical protein
MYYKVTVFNCTNPAAVVNGSKPVLEEIGPFVYREYTQRLDVHFDTDELTRERIWFKEWKYYVFAPELSGGLDDTAVRITTLRMPAQVLKSSMMAMLYTSGTIRNIWNNYTAWNDHTRLFDTHTVREFLFGYADDMMAIAHRWSAQVPVAFPGIVGNTSTAADAQTGGWHALYTGSAPYEQSLRQYAVWHDMTYMNVTRAQPRSEPHFVWFEKPSPMWGSSAANMIGGTDGSQFALGLLPGQSVRAWVDNLGRSIALVNVNGTAFTYDGIRLLRFTVAPYQQENATINPANAAFYQTGPGGFFNNSIVEPGAPEVWMSQPHFCGVTDEWVLTGVEGLRACDPDLDTTFIDVEPASGIPMHAWKRLQVNVYVHPYEYTRPVPWVFHDLFPFPNEMWWAHVRPTVWPVLTVEQGTVACATPVFLQLSYCSAEKRVRTHTLPFFCLPVRVRVCVVRRYGD